MNRCRYCGAETDGTTPTCDDCFVAGGPAGGGLDEDSLALPLLRFEATLRETPEEAASEDPAPAPGAHPEPLVEPLLEPLRDRVPEPAPVDPPAPVYDPPPSVAAGRRPGPPVRSTEAMERWNTLLDQSPVFAGMGEDEDEVPRPPLGGDPAGSDEDAEAVSPYELEGGALEIDVETRFDLASAPAARESVVNLLVTLAPRGAPLMDAAAGPVAHVILALDMSASMNHMDKYPVLTRALSGMLNDLRAPGSADVLISVVAFAYGSQTLIRDAPASGLEPRRLLDALDGWHLRFSRYTDIVGALHRAGRLALDSLRRNRAMPVRIYLMTDGRPQDMPRAKGVMAKIAQLPVDVHGLAFGQDADVACLQQLVSGGRGASVKQVRADTIEEAFGRIGDVAQRIVATRALLDVELGPGVIGGQAYRYRPARHRYPQGAFVRGMRFSTDLGTLESMRRYQLLFQLRLRRTQAAETEVGRIVLRVPGYGGPRVFERMLCLPRHDVDALPERDPEVAAALDVLEALENDDPQATLKALRMRRQLYAAERRDEHLLAVLDKAICELEQHGSLAALTAAEHAALISHTLTRRARRPSPHAPSGTGPAPRA